MKVGYKISALSGVASLLTTVLFLGVVYWKTGDAAKVDPGQLAKDVASLRAWALGMGAVALCVALGLGAWLASYVTRAIHNVAEVLKQLNLGNLDVSYIPMGKAVDCGSMAGCGNTECRSYGKDAYCWVEAGSFNADPHCPKAQKGLDCRECKIYKKAVHDEFEELGSVLNTMGDKLREVVREIQMSALYVAEGSEALSDSSQTMSQGAVQQAASVEETMAPPWKRCRPISCRTRRTPNPPPLQPRLQPGKPRRAGGPWLRLLRP